MTQKPIHPHPVRSAAVALLESAGLPARDLTDAHMEHFFFCGPASAPTGLVGVELHGPDALLRSLAVLPERRSLGLGRTLVEHAETHARAKGVQSLFLLTTTAAAFFERCGYRPIAREKAPDSIRNTREFADLCPASSAVMLKRL